MAPSFSKRVWGILFFLWMVVIFIFSSFPGSEYPFDPPLWYYLERKGAHVFEYAVLAVLAAYFYSAMFPKEKRYSIAVLSLVTAIAYGISDELHQYYVLYRGSRIGDVFFDAAGALLGCFFWYKNFFLRKKPYKR
ncbi:MAG: VanZ family protein [Candidatus Moranbacteria bacterium]|nr:VanZ family protein [Candidatus Moranbacteria bacterium]